MPEEPREGVFAALYNFFRSLKLAVALILVLTLLSVVATLIPQAQEPAFYFAQYSRLGAVLIGLGFDSMFSSFLFLLPAGLFFLNISVCTVHRFVARWRSEAKRRYGPDLIHVGLLLLMTGAAVTFFGRTEEFVQLRVGQSADVPGGFVITLDDFVFEQYEDGSPKDWLSVVSVTKDAQVVKDRAVIEVNSSLKLSNLKFYQSSYGLDEGIILADVEGQQYWLTAGDVIPLGGDQGLVLREAVPGPFGTDPIALFEIWEGHDVVGRQTYTAGSAVGEWIMTQVVYDYYTGLQMVHDPGYRTVLIALIMITVGLFATYIQKLGDNKV